MSDQTQVLESWQKNQDKFWAEFKMGMQELKAQMQETGRKMQETDRQMKETDRKIGELGNRFGELAEHLVAPNIWEKFNDLGYHFDGIAQNYDIVAGDRKAAEVDILLENEEFSIAVEVKAKPSEKDVDRHIERIEILRQYKDRHHDPRKLMGAIAGAIMPQAVRDYALKSGFYVIEQTGDTVKIEVPKGFKPRTW
jgi:hypothetical protein